MRNIKLHIFFSRIFFRLFGNVYVHMIEKEREKEKETTSFGRGFVRVKQINFVGASLCRAPLPLG